MFQYPFEFAKTRVQLKSEGKVSSQNPFVVVRDVIRKEGPRALYKGCSTLVAVSLRSIASTITSYVIPLHIVSASESILSPQLKFPTLTSPAFSYLSANPSNIGSQGNIAKDSLRFLTFDRIKSAFASPETGQLSATRSLLAGMTAGIVASTFAVTPSERIKTAMIDDARSTTNGSSPRFKGPFHTTATLIREGGLSAVYRGFVTTTLKQMGTTSVRLGSYNIIKDFETSRDISQTTAVSFANGAVAGTVTTYATQPFDVIKTRAQSARGAGTVEAFQSVMQDYGVKGLWKGTTMRLGRTVMAGGILFTSYEWAVAILNPMIPV